MTPKRPAELITASQNAGRAYLMADLFTDAGKKELAQEALKAAGWLDEIYRSRYAEWQAMGGTSDIESIALDGLGASAIVTDDNYRETRAAEWEAWRNRMSGFVARMENSRGRGLRKSVLK